MTAPDTVAPQAGTSRCVRRADAVKAAVGVAATLLALDPARDPMPDGSRACRRC